MANTNILGQMLEAAASGGLRGGSGAQSGQGGLGDLLGSVLGGGQQGGGGANAARGGGADAGGSLSDILGGMLGGGAAAAPGSGAGGAGGSLGDILGQVLGGGGAAAAPGGRAAAPGGSLGDILGQVLGGGAAAQRGAGGAGGSLGDILGQVLGGAGAGAPPGGGARGAGGGFSDALRDLAAGQGNTSSPASVPRQQSPRSMPTPDTYATETYSPETGAPGQAPAQGMNDLVKYGGIAVLGMLAYKALRNWQASEGPGGPAPSGKGFLPGQMPGGGEVFSGVLVKSMIAATQADGVVDEDEQRRIVGQLDQLGMDAAGRREIANQLRQRVDQRELVDAAKTPEMGLEIYAASALAIRMDTPAERQYLDGLAASLGIQPGLKAQVEQMVGRA